MFVLSVSELCSLFQRNLVNISQRSVFYEIIQRDIDCETMESCFEAMFHKELLTEDGQLVGGFSCAMDIVSDPVCQIRVVHVEKGKEARSTYTASDGLSGVCVLSDGKEIVLTPTIPLLEFTDGISDAMVSDRLLKRGGIVDLVGVEALLLRVIGHHALSGNLTVQVVIEHLDEMGCQTLVKEDIVEAFDDFCRNGWLTKRAGCGYNTVYTASSGKISAFKMLMSNDYCDLIVGRFTEEGLVNTTSRYCLGDDEIWHVSPIETVHEHECIKGVSELSEITRCGGIRFVSQSYQMIHDDICRLLRVDRNKSLKTNHYHVRLRK